MDATSWRQRCFSLRNVYFHNKLFISVVVAVIVGLAFIWPMETMDKSTDFSRAGAFADEIKITETADTSEDDATISTDQRLANFHSRVDLKGPCRNFTMPETRMSRNLSDPMYVPFSSITDSADPLLQVYTVVVLVRTRASQLAHIVHHYVHMSSVTKLLVVWNVQTHPPHNITETLTPAYRVKLAIEQLKENRLTSRFSFAHEIESEAVFSVDDDMLVDERDLRRAHSVWKMHPWGLVGFHARDVQGTVLSGFTYNLKQMPYRLVLTGAAFLHRNFLRLYTERSPVQMRNDVDTKMNCEDIAMNFVISDYCKCTAGFYVVPLTRIHLRKPTARDLSGRKRHHGERSWCINRFVKYYRNFPLLPNFCTF